MLAMYRGGSSRLTCLDRRTDGAGPRLQPFARLQDRALGINTRSSCVNIVLESLTRRLSMVFSHRSAASTAALLVANRLSLPCLVGIGCKLTVSQHPPETSNDCNEAPLDLRVSAARPDVLRDSAFHNIVLNIVQPRLFEASMDQEHVLVVQHDCTSENSLSPLSFPRTCSRRSPR